MKKAYDVNNIQYIENQIASMQDSINNSTDQSERDKLEKLKLKYESSLQKLKEHHGLL